MEYTSPCSVIIVTHNSQAYIDTCIRALQQQTLQPFIVIIDSGSENPSYLCPYQNIPQIHIELIKENIGFCQGNNIGMAHLPSSTEYVLFLNPDAFLTSTFIERALEHMEQPPYAQVGALSGYLLGYNIQDQQPTRKVDSTGIFQTWYGRWYDRDQGLDTFSIDRHIEQVPALCGALMFCRKKALDSVVLQPHVVMDPSFYMYKEDIDLSLRLRKKGWKILFVPHLMAYHCRGWQKDRTKIPFSLRLMSARNEMRLHARLYSLYFFYSAIKYLGVKMFNL